MKLPLSATPGFSALPRFSLAVVGWHLALAVTFAATDAPTSATPAPAAATEPATAVKPTMPAPAVVAATPIRPNTAIIPVPQRLEDRLPQQAVTAFNTRHDGYVTRAKQGDIDLLFLGDSITQNWSSRGKETWDKYYGQMKAAAFGIGYDRTQHLLWRLQNGEGEGFTPKAIVLMIGTNNLGPNTPEETAVGIGAIVHELRARFASSKILLLGIFPRNAKDSADRRRVAETNKLIAPLHDGQQVFFMDLIDQFVGADGNMLPGMMADAAQLHPSPQGHAVWAEAIKEPLANLMK